MCKFALWLYSYFTQTSPSKNKDINYIFIYLRVFPCLSCGSIYDYKLNGKFFSSCQLISAGFGNSFVSFHSFRVFHITVSQWYFSEVWVTASLFRTLLSILADLNNAVVRMVPILPPISNSSSPFSNSLKIVPSESATIGITVTRMVHSYFTSLAMSIYFSIFSLSFFFSRCVWLEW